MRRHSSSKSRDLQYYYYNTEDRLTSSPCSSERWLYWFNIVIIGRPFDVFCRKRRVTFQNKYSSERWPFYPFLLPLDGARQKKAKSTWLFSTQVTLLLACKRVITMRYKRYKGGDRSELESDSELTSKKDWGGGDPHLNQLWLLPKVSFLHNTTFFILSQY